MTSPRHGRGDDHPLAGYLFLLIVAALLFGVARAGIESSRRAQMKTEMREAVEAGTRGDYGEAESKLRALVREHPDEVDALFNLGLAELALEHDQDADALFAKVLALNPKDYDAMVERAAIQKHRGHAAAALEILDAIPAGQGHLRERLLNEWE
jgi:tetratricopeptide (TPR) repeat protein